MTRNNADFQGYTFSHSLGHFLGPTEYHVVTATSSEGDEAGKLYWDKESGRIRHIGTAIGHRGNGVATGMYRYAQSLAAASGGSIPSPEHSEERTEAGDAWARSVGGYLPENEYDPEEDAVVITRKRNH